MNNDKLVRSLCGSIARVSHLVGLGVLVPVGGRPGQGYGYGFTEDDVRDAEVIGKLAPLISDNAVVMKGILDHWRSLGRPTGYLGYAQGLGPRWWSDHVSVMGTFSQDRGVLVAWVEGSKESSGSG